MKPYSIKLLKNKTYVLFSYNDNRDLILDSSFLRAASPSAENKKHAKTPDRSRFMNIKIINIESVGNYAVKFVFDDGHDTGIYSWDYILEIGRKINPL